MPAGAKGVGVIYLKRFLILLIVILLGVFAVQNQVYLGQRVELVFFKFHATLVLGFWIVISFLLGALLFLTIDLPRTLSLRRDVRRKANEIARLQFELNRAAAAHGVPPAQPPPPPDLENRLGL
jgi:uncharacterized integral membrane protein